MEGKIRSKDSCLLLPTQFPPLYKITLKRQSSKKQITFVVKYFVLWNSIKFSLIKSLGPAWFIAANEVPSLPCIYFSCSVPPGLNHNTIALKLFNVSFRRIICWLDIEIFPCWSICYSWFLIFSTYICTSMRFNGLESTRSTVSVIHFFYTSKRCLASFWFLHQGTCIH